uniref:Uncharacterized protein n=1 Tax=Rhizophora mucronata TaxID=61149 RepID=A0A2P2P8E1_RHIMU
MRTNFQKRKTMPKPFSCILNVRLAYQAYITEHTTRQQQFI